MERDLGPYPKEMEREKDPSIPAESQYEKTSWLVLYGINQISIPIF